MSETQFKGINVKAFGQAALIFLAGGGSAAGGMTAFKSNTYVTADVMEARVMRAEEAARAQFNTVNEVVVRFCDATGRRMDNIEKGMSDLNSSLNRIVGYMDKAKEKP